MAKDAYDKISSIEHIPLSQLIEETAEDTGKSNTEMQIIIKQFLGNLSKYLEDGYAVNVDTIATFYPDVVFYGEPAVTVKASVSKVLTKKCKDTDIKYKKDDETSNGFVDIIL